MILSKNCINYDYAFISGEEGKTKQEGDLFLHVLNVIGIEKTDLIHIGDNKISDYSMPMSIGIKAVLYQRRFEPLPYLLKRNDIICDHYNSLIRNGFIGFEQKYKDEYKIGFTVMGPVITSFCQWIHNIKEIKKLDRLIFLAREGYAIKNIYNLLYPNDCHYVQYARINKHVLRIPLLTKNNLSELLKSTLKNNRFSTWRFIFASLNISNIDDVKLPKDQNLDSVILISELDDVKYDDVKKYIVEKLAGKIDLQSVLLREYLINLNISNRRVGLVNNSYSGNGQKLLLEFVDRNNLNVDITGVQFAANSVCKKVLGDKFVSWLSAKDNSLMAYLFERGSLIFEHLLFEPSGTAIGLDRDSYGNSYVVCEQARMEKKDFDKIAAYQAGMMDFAKLVHKNIDCTIGTDSMRYFLNLIQKPSKRDAFIIGNLHDDDTDIDRAINDYEEDFSLEYLYKNDIYNRVSWVQGFLRVKSKTDIFRKLFNIRLYITHYYHKLRGRASEYF